MEMLSRFDELYKKQPEVAIHMAKAALSSVNWAEFLACCRLLTRFDYQNPVHFLQEMVPEINNENWGNFQHGASWFALCYNI